MLSCHVVYFYGLTDLLSCICFLGTCSNLGLGCSNAPQGSHPVNVTHALDLTKGKADNEVKAIEQHDLSR